MAKNKKKKESKAKVLPPRKAKCPCCNKERLLEETPLSQIEKTLESKKTDPWGATADGWSFTAAKQGSLQWACLNCLKSGKAIQANPWEQTYCDHLPYFAYFDLQSVCSDCGETFIFGATEQKFWYEELNFWVQSYAKQCLTCRRLRREGKQKIIK